LSSTRPTAAVIVPALNEEANIAALIAEIETVAAEPVLAVEICEIVIVDNGSTDETAARAREAGATVVAEPRRGYGRACLTGAETATAEILVFMDGDRSEVPAELPLLLGPYLDEGAGLVIGSRVRGTMERGALSPQQLVGNRIGAWLMRLIHRIRITDFGPYRVVGRDTLRSFGMKEMTYGWPTEMIVRASQRGLRIVEVPVTCRRRGGGESKVSGSVRASLLTGWRMLSIMLRCWWDGRQARRATR
jgi:glycosyltransferase involved in cell wall biosynthesis